MNTPKLRTLARSFVILGLLTATALAAASIYLRGNLAGTVTSTPLSATQVQLVVNAAGQVSHLGRTHATFSTVVDFSGPVPVPVSTAVGSATAANGDQILFTQSWTAVPVGGTQYVVTAILNGAGGTGRFAGSTGAGTYVARVDLATGTVSARIDGTLFR